MTILGFPATIVAFIVLAGLGVGGVLYALFFTSIENEQKTAKPLSHDQVGSRPTAPRAAPRSTASRKAQKRKKQVQDSLHDLEERNKDRVKDATNPR
jgi:Flp pilus assembly protein TadB